MISDIESHTPFEPAPEEKAPSSTGWMIATRGLLAIIFGVITLVNPRAAAIAFVAIFAAWAFIDAAFAFVAAARRGRWGLRWGWFLFEGLVSIAAGVIALAYPKLTLIALVFIVAIRAMALGFLEVGGALSWRGGDRGERWLYGVAGILSLLFGVLLIVQPFVGALALLWTIGIYAIIFGVAQLIAGLRHQRPEPTTFIRHRPQAPAPS
jgi:uncharacterized membrane protein HdeD (DUF308 family)